MFFSFWFSGLRSFGLKVKAIKILCNRYSITFVKKRKIVAKSPTYYSLEIKSWTLLSPSENSTVLSTAINYIRSTETYAPTKTILDLSRWESFLPLRCWVHLYLFTFLISKFCVAQNLFQNSIFVSILFYIFLETFWIVLPFSGFQLFYTPFFTKLLYHNQIHQSGIKR